MALEWLWTNNSIWTLTCKSSSCTFEASQGRHGHTAAKIIPEVLLALEHSVALSLHTHSLGAHTHVAAYTHTHTLSPQYTQTHTVSHAHTVSRNDTYKSIVFSTHIHCTCSPDMCISKECQENPIFTNLNKKGFEHIQLPAKLLDHFLRTNKHNINQWQLLCARSSKQANLSNFDAKLAWAHWQRQANETRRC